MAALASDLSAYTTDVVVAVSEGGINTFVNEYLSQLHNNPAPGSFTQACWASEVGQPPQVFFPSADLDPFAISDGTSVNDSRVVELQQKGFLYGIRLQVGLPPSIAPIALYPPVVSLIQGASKIGLTLYFFEFTIVQLLGATSTSAAQWISLSQQSSPWTITTQLSLKKSPVNLNGNYLRTYPDKIAAIQIRVKTLPAGTSTTLVEVTPDFTNGGNLSTLTFAGLENHPLQEAIVKQHFSTVFIMAAGQIDQFPLAISAVTQDLESGTIIPIGDEAFVSPYLDDKGDPIPPSKVPAESAVTLSVIGNVNGPPPSIKPYTWNWLSESDANQENGIVAIRRDLFLETTLPVIAASFAMQPLPDSTEPHWFVFEISSTFAPSSVPVVVTLSDGVGKWTATRQAYVKTGELFLISMIYNGTITCKGNTIETVLGVEMTATMKIAPQTNHCLFYSATFTVQHTLTVTEAGDLEVRAPVLVGVSGGPIKPPPALKWCDSASLTTTATAADTALRSNVLADLPQLQAALARSLVFPGGNIFSFQNANFSSSGDLICGITFNAPSTSQAITKETTVVLNDKILGRRASNLSAVTGDTVDHPIRSKKVTNEACDKTLSSNVDDIRSNNDGQANTATQSLTYTTGLMSNRIRGQAVSPTEFEALQLTGGLGLLIHLDNGDLQAALEQSGVSEYSYASHDLSTALLHEIFPTDASATVRSFAAGQSVLDRSLGIAMTVTSQGSDHLFLSLANSGTDSTWLQNPKWKAYPFDAVDSNGDPIPMKNLTIYGISFTETFQISLRFPAQQFIIVDINRSPLGQSADIARYYIDWYSETGPFWVEHEIGIDIESGSYQSCGGRAGGEFVDGVYTMGTAGNASQLLYKPLVNDMGEGPPLGRPLWLQTPKVAEPISAIASARHDNNSNLETWGFTDLFAIGTTTLYYFAADQQGANGCAIELMTHPNVFAGCNKLIAMINTDVTTQSSTTTLWGLNGSQEVFYLSCPTSEVSQMASWSVPIPVLFGVTKISSFLNLADGGNTIFAAGTGGFQKIVQATGTENMMWKAQDMMVPPAANTPPSIPVIVKSHISTLLVANSDNSPASNIVVNIAATTRLSVYVNGFYTILGSTPLPILTDQAGTITIMETTDDINGTVITANLGIQTARIDPCDTAFAKLKPLQDQTTLTSAIVYTQTIAGGYLDTTETITLVPTSASPTDKSTLALGMSQLATSYPGTTPSSSKKTPTSPTRDALNFSRETFAVETEGIGDWIEQKIGDIYQAIKSAINTIGKAIVKVAATIVKGLDGVLTFFVTFGTDAYKAILKGTDAFLGAVRWLFHEIGTGIEDLIQFIEDLFAWSDISRTQQMISKMTSLYLNELVVSVPALKANLDGSIASLEISIGGINPSTDWSTLGSPATKTAGGNSTNPQSNQTSQSQLMSNHYKNQALNLTESDPSAPVQQSLVIDLMTALNSEATVLETAYNEFTELAKHFESMTIPQLLESILAIFVDGLLSSVQVVADTVLNILTTVGDDLIALMNAPITIPIISDILRDVGFPTVTFLELFSWIVAVSYTVVYKVAHDGVAPIIANEEYNALVDAAEWSTFMQEVHTQQKPLFITGHASAGVLGILYGIVHAIEAGGPGHAEATGGGIFGKASAVSGVLIALLNGGANAIAPQDPLTDPAAKAISDAVDTINMLSDLLFCGPVQSELKGSTPGWKKLAANDGRAVGAVVSAVLTIPQIACSAVHLSELNEIEGENGPKSAAIFDEVAKLCSYISTMSYGLAVNDPDDITKSVAIAVMGVADMVGGGLHIVESTMLS